MVLYFWLSNSANVINAIFDKELKLVLKWKELILPWTLFCVIVTFSLNIQYWNNNIIITLLTQRENSRMSWSYIVIKWFDFFQGARQEEATKRGSYIIQRTAPQQVKQMGKSFWDFNYNVLPHCFSWNNHHVFVLIVDFDANKYSFELVYIYLSDCLAAKLGEEMCSLSELIKFRPILQESGRFVNSCSEESTLTLLIKW